MSDIGIYTGNYQRVRNCAESVDRLLIDLKSGSEIDEEAVGPVVSLLQAMTKGTSGSPLAQLLNLRVRQRDAVLQRRIGTMAEELQTRTVSPETVDGLEKLARLLDHERVDLRAKLSEA